MLKNSGFKDLRWDVLDVKPCPTTISLQPVRALMKELLPDPVTPMKATTISGTWVAGSAVHVFGGTCNEVRLLRCLSIVNKGAPIGAATATWPAGLVGS